MKRVVCLMLLAVASVIVPIQIRTQPVAARNQSAATSGSDIDPDAVATLNRMGAYLRSLKVFQVEASTTKDEVLEDGQGITFDSHIDLLARTPDRLRVEVNNVRQHRLYLYDGKNFTLWAERLNYYATVPAPATIGKLADKLDKEFGIQLPLEDLFLWGAPQSKVVEIKGAMDVGPSAIGGVTCEHYAFRQPGLDWQVWIQQGEYPLPRKLVLTTLTDEARPQYSSVLTWNLAPSFNDAAFEFEPPKDAQKIVFAGVGTPTNGEKQ